MPPKKNLQAQLDDHEDMFQGMMTVMQQRFRDTIQTTIESAVRYILQVNVRLRVFSNMKKSSLRKMKKKTMSAITILLLSLVTNVNVLINNAETLSQLL